MVYYIQLLFSFWNVVGRANMLLLYTYNLLKSVSPSLLPINTWSYVVNFDDRAKYSNLASYSSLYDLLQFANASTISDKSSISFAYFKHSCKKELSFTKNLINSRLLINHWLLINWSIPWSVCEQLDERHCHIQLRSSVYRLQ